MMRKEFLIERQGRSFVLYAGLLDEAHSKGLKSIRTHLVQSPTPENGYTTICSAEVELEDGRVFSGIGDATPENVGRTIVPHAIRMAETRAKARALRDAINVGVVSVEELGDMDDGPHQAGPPARSPAPEERPSRPPAARSNPPAPVPMQRPPAAGSAATTELATPAQVRAIYLIGRDHHSLSDAQMDERAVERYGATPAELTKQQASELITAMNTTTTRTGGR